MNARRLPYKAYLCIGSGWFFGWVSNKGEYNEEPEKILKSICEWLPCSQYCWHPVCKMMSCQSLHCVVCVFSFVEDFCRSFAWWWNLLTPHLPTRFGFAAAIAILVICITWPTVGSFPSTVVLYICHCYGLCLLSWIVPRLQEKKCGVSSATVGVPIHCMYMYVCYAHPHTISLSIHVCLLCWFHFHAFYNHLLSSLFSV